MSILILFISLSCDDILNTSHITLSIPAGVSEVYVAVFDGEVSLDGLLVK